MYYIQSETHFDSAHFLSHYQGACSNIHGHRWKVVVCIAQQDLQENTQNNGMVMDFKELKKDLTMLAEQFDHTFIVERHSLSPALTDLLQAEGFFLTEVDFRPTAENFARYFYYAMKEKDYPVHSATVYETPNNCAEYREEV